MQYKKFLVSVCGLALLLGLSTSLVGCETGEVEETEEEIEQPVEEEVEED